MKKISSLKLFLPIIITVFFSSCNLAVSIDQMIRDFNHNFNPEFGSEEEIFIPEIILRETLIPETAYEIRKGYGIEIKAEEGFIDYKWTFKSASGKMYGNVDTGMEIVHINTVGFEKGDYILSLTVKDSNTGTKYTDTATVKVY